ncbi:hypothetical protein [Flavobacterium microcysteis]|uniref:Lipoprotein n=1 Tax=Flavobacterium microcysteis TaxID=2596891 RepID=A0A501QMC3_9FLAO|nr:hypothetical protein [Flavobacterium microcysteis]TPD73743.1 hypothetical protein FJA49_00165 [Flavobacterium microcysteis]
MKKLLCIIVMLTFCFCSKKENKVHRKERIKTTEIIVDSLFNNYGIMFVKIDGSKFASTNSNHLRRFYNRNFSNKYPSFETFVPDALAQKIIFEEDKFKGRNIVVFSLDKNIKTEYETSGIKYLLNKYCEKGKDNYTVKNQDSTEAKFFTILYYLFMNGNRISFDDVGGFYIIKVKNV